MDLEKNLEVKKTVLELVNQLNDGSLSTKLLILELEHDGQPIQIQLTVTRDEDDFM